MTTVPAAAKVTQYDLTLLPREWEASRYWRLTVEWRGIDDQGADLWAVCWGSQCATRRGVWTYERSPSNRTDRWLASHRFDEQTALDLADRLLPKLVINGSTAADVIARHEAGQ